jgi:ribose-phosphate pyrophosphokinase
MARFSDLTKKADQDQQDLNLLSKPAVSRVAQAVDLRALEGGIFDANRLAWGQDTNFDVLHPSELQAVESLLEQQIGNSALSYIYVGHKRFELVSREEALLYRQEREVDFLRSRLEKATSASTKLREELCNCVVYAGPASRQLGDGIIQRLGIEPGPALFGQFANGESRVRIEKSVRDRDLFIIQTIAEPVNDSITELGLLADAAKRASVRSITAIIPYFGYSRQDRKGEDRSPVSARWVADQYQNSGVDRVVTVDIHSEQVEGFFDRPMDNLAAFPLFIPHLAKRYSGDKLAVVSPDSGGMKRAEKGAELLSRYLANNVGERDAAIGVECMYKRRERANEVAESRLTGDGDSIRGATCILIDDILDTGGSALKAAKTLRSYGASKVVVCATHGLFSRNGVSMFRNAVDTEGKRIVDEIVVTDTLPLRRAKGDLITVVSVQPLLAEAIRRICAGNAESLRELKGFGLFGNRMH